MDKEVCPVVKAAATGSYCKLSYSGLETLERSGEGTFLKLLFALPLIAGFRSLLDSSAKIPYIIAAFSN